MLATLGFYTSLVLLFKLKPSKKAVEAPAGTLSSTLVFTRSVNASNADMWSCWCAPVAASSSQSDEIPSILSDEFEEWSKISGNFERWEKSLETIGN